MVSCHPPPSYLPCSILWFKEYFIYAIGRNVVHYYWLFASFLEKFIIINLCTYKNKNYPGVGIAGRDPPPHIICVVGGQVTE
jgi:hypothetical protein